PAALYAYRDEALSLPKAFNVLPTPGGYFESSATPGNPLSDAGATLGRVLFYDRRLSITNSLSCGSCHRQVQGFASAQRFDSGVLGMALTRNSIALGNVRYSINKAWFADMRSRSLAELVRDPLQNHVEMGMPMGRLVTRLQGVAFYPPLFAAAFGTSDITAERIAFALEQFMQALITYRSKYDRAVNSLTFDPADPAAVFDARELRGFRLYSDHCARCHAQSLNTNDWHSNNGLDEVPLDPGTTNPAFMRNGARGVFRAASLRNIARTAPYMHDGRFNTLREVIDHYDHGIKDSPDLDATLRDPGTGKPQRLNLSEADKDALEALLLTLTDEAFLTDPKFADPFP
ncbi:MAG: cytochrome c peroxidase, partial [Steroidobacteraceae bacterium]